MFDGGVKRGPSEADSYFNTVELSDCLKVGKNTVCALVWYWGRNRNFSYTDSDKRVTNYS